MFESESNNSTKKILEWVSKKTDSNYAIIDASDFKDKFDGIKKISQLNEKLKKEFETKPQRTFLFIENLDRINNINTQKEIIYAGFKNFLDNTSKHSHNTIVISTKSSSKFNSIISGINRSSLEVKVDKTFMQAKHLGYNTILSEINEIKSTTKEIKILSIKSIYKDSIEKIQILPKKLEEIKAKNYEKKLMKEKQKLIKNIENTIKKFN